MNKLLGLLLLLLVGSGCKRESDLPLLHPDDFTAAHREQLGDRLALTIFNSPALYPTRSIQSSGDSILYNYLSWQYDQVANFYHFDPKPSAANRWNPNRSWGITIIQKDDPFAFAIPGGDFFISEGMLQKLEGVDQLYALLALELTRMQGRFLFYKFIESFNTNTVLDFIETGQTNRDISGEDFLATIMTAIYDPEFLQQLDIQTLNHICRSSLFDPAAILTLEAHFQDNFDEWIARKSYSGRANYLINNLEAMADDCGTRGDEGDYQYYILDNL